MDILNGEDMYEVFFEFKVTEPIGKKWEFFGIENSNFINNSGSYFVLILLTIVVSIVLMVINKISVKCANQYNARIVGMAVYYPSYWV